MDRDWTSISKEDLSKLTMENTNKMIAEMYGVTVNQVRYKRKKFGISMYDLTFQHTLEDAFK